MQVKTNEIMKISENEFVKVCMGIPLLHMAAQI